LVYLAGRLKTAARTLGMELDTVPQSFGLEGGENRP
jgi:hypothetical protein